MIVWRHALDNALRLINVVQIDQPLQSDHLQTGLKAINIVLDSWSRMGIRPDGIPSITVAVSSSQVDLPDNAPHHVLAVLYCPDNVSGAIPLRRIEWATSVRRAVSDGAYPERYTHLNEATGGKIYLDQNPGQGSLLIYGYPAFAEVDDLDESMSAQSGYESAFVYCLADELQSWYPPVDPNITLKAEKMRLAIMPKEGMYQRSPKIPAGQDGAPFTRRNY